MSVVEVAAHAKVNLLLRVLAREEDGFHGLETIFALLDLHDSVRIERTDHAGVTLTVATVAGVTVIAAVALLPSMVAVMVAVPGATAVTRPLLLTSATAGFAELHVTVRPEREPPTESSGVAVNWLVCLGCRLTVAGATVTLATVGGFG